ncbi:hypothetical protein [Psychromicrobium lacuslunae]|uniref:hypothetical protein n=1 Tax=Psychromicrobium lacuslunae TaxID=1618207 RepID=UPI0005D32EBF|nr:hypothetical protein [Psychromicrobium lacuslunae]
MISNRNRAISAFISAIAVVLLCTGCFTINSPDPNASTPSGPAPSYLQRLKATQTVEPSATAAKTISEGQQGFLNPGHDIACIITSARGGHVNTPLEPNDFDNSKNQRFPVIPVVQCELAGYPAPQPKDVRDNCGGTGIGYLGGVVLLAPGATQYGACRIGQTGMEASSNDASSSKKVIAQLPTLAAGTALDAQGYRCAPLDDGVACANLSNGVGFFVSKDSYQLFSK